MNTKSLMVILGLLALCFCAPEETLKALRKYCNALGSPRLYLLLDGKEPISWNLNDALNNAKTLGSGSYGVVYEVKFDGLQIPQTSHYANRRNTNNVAVKRFDIDITTVDELEAMILMSKTKYGMQVFGCQLKEYDPSHYKKNQKVPEDKIFIVMDKLGDELAKPGPLKMMKKLSPDERITYYAGLFEQTIAFFEYGYLHNDIKPENTLYDEINKRLVLIDFGCAQSTKNYLRDWGSPLYMSPNKFDIHQKNCQLVDDLFSLALTIITIENDNDAYEIFNDDTGHRTMQCMKFKKPECRLDMIVRASEILRRKGFSKPTSSADKYNFINLLQRIIEYSGFNDTPDEVKAIVRKINMDAEKRILKAQNAAQKVAETKQKKETVFPRQKEDKTTAEEMMARYKKRNGIMVSQKEEEVVILKKEKARDCSFFGLFDFLFGK